jgi:oxamate amidohydrolase
MDTPTFAAAAVAAPHMSAVEAGRAVLEEGGNALEAMIAVAAAIAVVYPHMNGVGGDSFWVVHAPGAAGRAGHVRSIEACGFAGEHATIERYRKLELAAIPVRGPHAALTVPGTIGGWALADAMAKEHGGRLPRDMLLHHAIQLAREGHPVGASEARYIVKEEQAVLDLPFFKETLFIDGERPKEGAIRRLPALAATLQQLSDAGYDDFYRGDVARELAADMERAGTPVTRTDLARYRAVERKPLSARLRDCTLYQPQPPSQGFAALLMLGIVDEVDAGEGESIQHWHAFIESVKRANTIRDHVVTEYERLTEDPQDYLTRDRFRREAERVDMGRAAPWPLPRDEDGDTIWAGVIDKDGMAVSLIQSLFWGCSCRTGVSASRSTPRRSTRSSPAAGRSTRCMRRWRSSMTAAS